MSDPITSHARSAPCPSLAEIFFGRLANFWRRRRAQRVAPARRLQFQAIEPRILLSADLVFNVPVDLGADDFTLRLDSDSGNLQLLDGETLVASQALAETTGVVINGEDGWDDSLTIDFAFGGFFALDAGITFNGGSDGFDALEIMGGQFTAVTHTVTATGPGLSGNIVYEDGLNPALTINYTGLEPVDMTGSTIADLVFNLPGTNDQAILEDSGTAADGVSQIRSQNGTPTFDTTTFSSPTSSLTVNMGGDSGTFTVNSPDSTFTAALTINGQAGTDNVLFSGTANLAALTVTVGGSITDSPAASLSVTNNARFSGSSITLGDSAGNTLNFVTLSFAGGAVSIAEDSATVFTGTSSASSLVLTAGGSITDDAGADIDVTAGASFAVVAGQAITLGDQAGNVTNFGTLNFNSTNAVSITEDSDTVLAGGNSANNATITSAGSLTDTADADISVTNNARFVAGGSITLGDQAGNLDNFGTVTFNSVGHVAIDEDSASAFAGANTAGSLNFFSANQMTDASGTSIAVTDNATFRTGSLSPITLGDNAADILNFGTLTIVSTGAVVITEDSATVLTGVSTASSLVLTTGGSITDDADADLSVTNNASFLSGANAITLGDQAGNVVNFGSLTFSGGAVSISEDSATVFTGTSSASSLVLTAGGSITDDADADLSVTNNASFLSGANAITLGDQAGNLINLGTLSFNAAGAVNITEDSTMVLSEGSAGSVTIAASGITLISLNASANITATSTGGNIAINGAVSADDNVVLLSALGGQITTGAGGSLVAGSLNALASTGIDLANTSIDTLQASNTTGAVTVTDNTANLNIVVPGVMNGGPVNITTLGTLTLTGNIVATGSTATLTTGTVVQASGTVIATNLILNTATGATLTNLGIANLTAANSISGNLSLTTTGALNIVGPGVVNTVGTITISTPGILTVMGDVNAGSNTVILNSTGASIGQTGGTVTGGLLDVDAVSGITLISTAVATLDAVNTGSGAISVTDAGALNLLQANNSTRTVSVTATDNLSLTGATTAGTANLSGGAISRTTGTVSATTLNLASVTGTTLGAGLIITNLSSTNTGAGSTSITLPASVNITGVGLANTGGSATLNVTGDITFQAGTNVPVSALTLNATGAITQTTGTIGAGTLIINTGTVGPLDTAVGNLQVDRVAGDVNITNTGALTISGAGINDGVGNINLTTTDTLTVAATLASGTGDMSLTAPSGVFFTASAVVNVDVGGTDAGEFTTITISDAVSLAGTLDAEVVGLFLPVAGDRFPFMTFDSRTGFFDNTFLPDDFVIEQNDNELALVFAPQATPSISINDVSLLEGNSGLTDYVFSVSLSNPSSQTVTVDYSTTDGTATLAGGDYLAASGSVVFAPGQTIKTVSVSVNGDVSFEPNETFTVNLSAPLNANIVDSTGLGTILNDDNQPTISINDVSLPEGNGGLTGFIFTASLSNPSSQTVTVEYSTADGTATLVAGDYLGASGSVVFAPGQTSHTISVSVNGDVSFEPDETFTVDLSAAVNATIADGTGIGTIVNDDPRPTISINDVTLLEGNSGLTGFIFTASLSNPSSQTVTVDYSTDDGTATVAGNDYVAASGSVVFAPGQTSNTISVSVNGDVSFEPDETFTVSLSAAVNATIVDGTGMGTIVNDDAPNDPPVLAPIGNQAVNEHDLLTFTASATDPDLPPDVLMFSLDAGAPAGAVIDPHTGVFMWTPTETQGGATYSITVRVTDDGVPVLDDFETILVTVVETFEPELVGTVNWDPDDLLTPGDREHVTVVVSNVGDATADGQVKVKIYASVDETFDASDVFLDESHTGADIQPGGSKQAQVNFAFPGTLLPGHYFLLALVDPENQIAESNEANNTALGEEFDFHWMFGNVPGHGHETLTVRDADGSWVNFSLIGPGTGEITIEDGEWDLVVTGTTGSSILSVLTLGGGDYRVAIDDIHVTGALRGILAPKMDLTGTLAIDGALGAGMMIGSATDAVIAIQTIQGTRFLGLGVQGITILGDLETSEILIGANLGADGQLGGSGADADTYSAGDLGDLLISGSMISSCVYAGGEIDSITILGEMTDDSGFVASDLPPYARIHGARVNSETDPRFWDGAIDWTAPASGWGDAGLSPFGSSAGSGQSNFSDFLVKL